ncbi:zinc-binding alcohol dehydrogenase family protein [Pontivivens ytuae]|uniref:Zinc-type alcohol dehydrogenase-like protein n=1 Tax=Pontivivens ytuae TaxID=2789856 RepID=A0A7S9LSJ2_9RHOB|nr:zinc-binding alcohol dehydrogenase family protein [Pontivivens ytuae]QPH54448.1 zinc-binding alcohol dehydrogenase family protein [Pontivivens ytuae]
MKAIGYHRPLPLDDAEALAALDLPEPQPGPRDLLVEVKAISVNPVDVKLRAGVAPEDGPRVLGFDASGIVRAVGPEVTLFKPGDEVFHAGSIARPGTNAELHLVDERIAARKPASLDHAQAAALPLTSITAWELLFDRFGIAEGSGKGDALLVIGGAGGVGSILIQLARQLTDLTVIATASRPETRAWAEKMGAHHVIDHRGDLVEQVAALNLAPRYVAGTNGTDRHFPAIAELMAPQGHFGLIDDPDPAKIDISLLKWKSIALHWEFMFTRSVYETPNMDAQHRLLTRVAELVDAGTLVTTANHDGGVMSVETLRDAHRLQESGTAIGKTVLTVG